MDCCVRSLRAVGDECGTSGVGGGFHVSLGVVLAALATNLQTLVIHREQL
jgi:hypothetical protein